MIEPTSPAQFDAWTKRAHPPVEQVAPGVWSIPVTCAPFPVRYTYCYVIVGEGGEFVIIDPGLQTAAGDAQLRAGLQRAGLSLYELRGIVVTHFHPDHAGAARALAESAGAWLGMHALDAAAFSPSEFEHMHKRDSEWLDSCGVPSDVHESLMITNAQFEHYFPGPTADVLLEDGALLPLKGRQLEVVWTPGHTAGHVCILDHDNKLAFTGDHILPRISPNVGIDTHDAHRDPVAEYEASLERLAPWDAYEACPAHEYRFRGIAERAGQLATQQQERSDEVAALLAGSPDASVWDIARQLTWSRGWESLDGQNLRGALAETSSHLIHLRLPVL